MATLLKKSSAYLLVMGLWAAPACTNDAGKVSGPFFKMGAERSLNIPGLLDRVEVLTDEQGVPHIYAVNDLDAARVQGYVTARDRFFQMEVLRKVSAGRLSELFGQLAPDDTLANDLEMRSIMMTSRGTMIFDELLAELPPDEQKLIIAYSDGINAWLADAQKGRNGAIEPSQYEKNPFVKPLAKFSDVEKWTPADTFAIGRFQQWNLSGSLGDELYIGKLRDILPADLFAATFRFAPADPTLSVDDFFDTPPVFTGLHALSSADADPSPKGLGGQLGSTLQRLQNPGRTQHKGNVDGSNNWVVGPALTKGNAMLANDPHLSMVNPPLFYHTHLNTKSFGKTGGVNAIGVTFPGIPGLLAGHNENLAWGVTTLGYDVMDLYVEDLVGDKVRFKGALVPVSYATQTIRFGTGAAAREEEHRIAYVAHHGAVISGQEALTGDDTKKLITMKWTGREPTPDFRAFFGLLKAVNIDDFFDAVSYFSVGAQSFVGADVEGNIGYLGAARVPIRDWDLETHPPDSSLPGTGAFEWSGFLSDDKLVQAKNPLKGYIATANNDIVGTTIDNNPYNDAEYYWYLQDVGFRIGRIAQLIEEHGVTGISLEDMAEIQNDTFSIEAERAVPRILAAMEGAMLDTRQASAVGYLNQWTFGTPTGIASPLRLDAPDAAEKVQAIGPSLYFTMQKILVEEIAGDEYGEYELSGLGGGLGLKLMFHVLEGSDDSLFDDKRTTDVVESRTDIVLRALDRTLDHLEERFGTADMTQWQWGKIHEVYSVDLVGMLTGVSRDPLGPVANDGAQNTIDVAGSNDEGLQGHGSQIRMVVELAPGAIKSFSVIPGGQVDQPDSPHKDDQWAAWVRNERFPYRFYDKDVVANAKSRWVFLP